MQCPAGPQCAAHGAALARPPSSHTVSWPVSQSVTAQPGIARESSTAADRAACCCAAFAKVLGLQHCPIQVQHAAGSCSNVPSAPTSVQLQVFSLLFAAPTSLSARVLIVFRTLIVEMGRY